MPARKPEIGYLLKGLMLKNETTLANTPITGNKFTMPASDVTVAAEFEKGAYFTVNGIQGTISKTVEKGSVHFLQLAQMEGWSGASNNYWQLHRNNADQNVDENTIIEDGDVFRLIYYIDADRVLHICEDCNASILPDTGKYTGYSIHSNASVSGRRCGIEAAHAVGRCEAFGQIQRYPHIHPARKQR